MRCSISYLIVSFTCLFASKGYSQFDSSWGISVDHNPSLVSNRQEVINDVSSEMPSSAICSPEGLWHSNSLTIDSYWFNGRMILSAGFNTFRMKFALDSVIPPLTTGPYYGRQTVSWNFILPKIGMAYRHPIGKKLSLQSCVSFGALEFLGSSKSQGVSYTDQGQVSWDKYNRTFGRSNWDIYLDQNAFFLELGQQINYDLHQCSLSTGLNYFFMRNRKFTGYHGLHLNIGCSVRFGKK